MGRKIIITKTKSEDDVKPIAWDQHRERWERQIRSGEKEEHYALFCGFRDMPMDERNINQFRLKVMPTLAVKRSLRVIYWCAHRYRWKERAACHDDFLEKKMRKTAEAELVGMTKKHTTIASNALIALSKPVEEFARRMNSRQLDFEKVGDAALLKMIWQSATALEKLVGVERLSRGVPNQVFGQILAGGQQEKNMSQVKESFADVVRKMFGPDGALVNVQSVNEKIDNDDVKVDDE
jgi:hypothetical protein